MATPKIIATKNVTEIREPEATEPEATEPEATEPEVEEAPVVVKVKEKKVVKVLFRIYASNPYSKQKFFPGQPVEAIYDSWLKCQVEAGLAQIC